MSYDLRCCGHPAQKHHRDFDRSLVWCEVCENQERGGCYEAPHGTARRPGEVVLEDEGPPAKG